MANEDTKNPPLKDLVNRRVVERLADRFASGKGQFDRTAFVNAATRGLTKLELKDRVRHVAAALKKYLDPDYDAAIDQILASLPPVDARSIEQWPLCHFVEVYGLDHFDTSMQAIHELTQRFTCEFAIRPYLVRYPEKTLRVLKRWMKDPSPDVRRLVSEGSRPRLPWGMRIQPFIEDPSRTRFLLDRLVDDPDEVVRRSAANHVNDIAKDHPEYAVEIARAWSRETTKNREAAIRHALRTLVKKGHPGALEMLGYRAAEIEVSRFQVTPGSVVIGGTVKIELELASKSSKDQRVLIDYTVHFRKANGKTSPKVFKWTTRTLASRGRLKLRKNQSLQPMSTRVIYPGEHTIEVLINGKSSGMQVFKVTDL